MTDLEARYRVDMKRMKFNQKHKNGQKREGKCECEVCGWKPPNIILGVHTTSNMLEVHHIIPINCGGLNEDRNATILCPNHHAVADRLGRHNARGSRKAAYWGPRTKEDLIDTLRKIDADPEGWVRDIAGEIASKISESV